MTSKFVHKQKLANINMSETVKRTIWESVSQAQEQTLQL